MSQTLKLIQTNVYQAPQSKLMYLKSPINKIYGNDGLNLNIFIEKNPTMENQINSAYRNMCRLLRYFQVYESVREKLRYLFKIRARQDYAYRRSIILSSIEDIEDINKIKKNLTNDEISRRLVNTVNFFQNSCIDSPDNKLKRPISMEYNIVLAVLDYEGTKNVSIPSKRFLVNSSLFNIETYVKYSKIEKSWRLSSPGNYKEHVWWIKDGLLDNDFCFKYIKDLKLLLDKEKSLGTQLCLSLLHMERMIILINEESELFL